MSHALAIEAVKDSPQILWRLHETTGTNVEDQSGNGNNGTYSGTPTLDQPGPLATITGLGEETKAVSFDGSDDKVKLASAVITAYPATIIARMKADAVVNGTDYAVVALADEASDNEAVILSVRGNGTNVRAQCNVRTGGADQIVSGSYDIAGSTFVEVAVRLVSATDREIYVNSVSVGTDTTSTTFPTGLDNTTVGTVEAATPTFHSGEVCEVRIYASDIGEDRIRAHYSVGQADQWWTRTVLRNDPYLFWRLNEASGVTAADQTVHGRDGTIAGSPTFGQGSLIVDDDAADSISFDGSDDSVDKGSLSFSGYPCTIETIIQSPATTTADTNYCVVGLFDASDPEDRLLMQFRTNSSNELKVRIFRQNGATQDQVAGTTLFTKGQRYHATLVLRSATDAEIYVGGVSEVTATNSVAFPGGLDRFSAGAFLDSTPAYEEGVIGDVVFYESELSEAEIYAHAKVAVTSSRFARQMHALKPEGYWRQNDASGNVADDSRHGEALTVTGVVDYEQGTPLTADSSGNSILYQSGEYAERGSTPSAIPSSFPFTMLQFFKTPASPATSQQYNGFSIADASVANKHVRMEVLEDGAGNINLQGLARNGGTDETINGSTNLTANTWYLGAFVNRDATDRELLLNNHSSEGTGSNSVTLTAGNDTISIARLGDSSPVNLPGQMAESAILHSSITIPEMVALYQISQTSTGQTFQESVSDTIGIDDALVLAFIQALTDSSGFNDSAGASWLKNVADTLGLDDSIDDVLKAFGAVSDALGLDDGLANRLVALEDVADQVGMDDTGSVLGKLLSTISETISFVVTVTVGGETYLGVAVNPRTQAVTTYRGWNFNSFCELDGVYLGASDDGVFELTGASDDGTDIDAVIELAVTRLGSNELKRLPEIYLHMQNDAPVILQVIHTEDDGSRKENWYEVRETSSALKTRRVKLKKGERSIDWGTRIRNKDGGTLILDGATLVPFEISRRLR